MNTGACLLSAILVGLLLVGSASSRELTDSQERSDVAPVTITASRSVRVPTDRRAYDVRVNSDLQTLNAQEIVARLPGVITDLQGRLSVLGQTAISYRINDEGVPAALALQIPAAQIDRVEMITNPGADTKGAARVIINFVLKAPRQTAYGVTRGQVDSLRRHELSLTIGRPVQAVDLVASMLVSREPQVRRSTYAQDFIEGQEAGLALSRFSEDHTADSRRQGQVMAGFKHGPWSYAVVGFLVDQLFSTERIRTERQALAGQSTNDFLLEERSALKNRGETISLVAQRKGVAQSKDSWSITPRWSDSESRLSQDLTNSARPDFVGWERSRSEGVDVKLSMERGETVAELLKFGIEAGKDRGRAHYRTEGYGEPEMRFDYIRESASAHVTRQFTRGGFQALPGLRIETARLQSRSDGAARVENVAFVRALPSLHLLYAPDGRTKLRASLSRRGGDIVAERYDATRRRIAYNGYRRGDPALKVEDQWVLESSYERVLNGRAFLATLYARQTHNSIQPYYDYLGDDRYIDLYINIHRSYRLGFNLNLKLQVGSKADLTLDIIGYQEDKHWILNGVENSRHSETFDFKINGAYRFSPSNSLSVVAQYSGREEGLETRSSSRISSSLKYVRAFNKDTSIAIEALDIMSTRKRTVSRAAPLYNSLSITEQDRRGLRATLSRSF